MVGKSQCPTSKAIRQEEFSFIPEVSLSFYYPSPNGMSQPILRRAIYFTQYIESNVNLIQKYPYRNTQNNL